MITNDSPVIFVADLREMLQTSERNSTQGLGRSSPGDNAGGCSIRCHERLGKLPSLGSNCQELVAVALLEDLRNCSCNACMLQQAEMCLDDCHYIN